MIRTIGSASLADDAEGGWTLRRHEVITEAAGVCARCDLPGADTAIRGWDAAELVAAHTRCVVGLGPPTRTPEYHLRAA